MNPQKPIPLSPLAKPNLFGFEMDQLRGRLQLDGPEHGLRSLQSKRTGYEWINPRLYALNFYRLLARNEWLGQGRDAPMRGQVQDHVPTITWPAIAQHRVQTTARYHFIQPATVDLELTFRFAAAYSDFEAFWGNYLAPGNQPYAFPARPYGRMLGPADAHMLPLVEAPLYKGCYLSFARDVRSAGLFYDGRYDKGKHSPVLWAKTRYLGLHMIMFAQPKGDEACVVMADPRTCFALGTVYKSDDPKDSVAHHHAVYVSLIGQNVRPEEVVRARMAMTIIRWTGKEEEPRAAYKQFLDRCQ